MRKAREPIFATVRKRKAEQEAEVKEAEIRDAKSRYAQSLGEATDRLRRAMFRFCVQSYSPAALVRLTRNRSLCR
jgi:hypothetical protein